MSLWDKLKGELIDIIEWLDARCSGALPNGRGSVTQIRMFLNHADNWGKAAAYSLAPSRRNSATFVYSSGGANPF